MLFEIGEWNVTQNNKTRHREIMEKIYVNIQTRRDVFKFLKSSKLLVDLNTHTGAENWCYIDEFESTHAYEANVQALLTDKPATELRNTWEKLITPSSLKTHLWETFDLEPLWI